MRNYREEGRMSALTASQVRGPVRTVRTEWAQWDPAKESWEPPGRQIRAEFRIDGKISLTDTHNPDGSVYRCENIYGDSGLLIESRAQLNGELLTRTLHFYDGDARPIRQTQQESEGTDRLVESWSYAPDGGMTQVFYVPQGQGAVDYYCAVDGVDFHCSAAGAATVATVFDSRGLVLEVRVLTVDGGLLRRLLFSWDESGRLVKDQLLLGDQPLVPGLPAFGAGTQLAAHTYIYDDHGRRSERVQRLFGMGEEREVFRYDERDNLTEVISDRFEPEATELGDGSLQYRQGTLHRQRTRFAYQYDSHGNWIEKVTSIRRAVNPDFTPCAVERREIDYYDNAQER
jgi:hypothetical protein